MALELHNTLTGRREPFRPADPGRITFYTCGPTVYDFAHIGNFRAFLVADVLRRWLQSPLCEIESADGSIANDPREVVHVMNLTDVGHMTDDALADGAGEDKMEAASRRLLEAKKAGTLPAGVDVDPRDPRAIADFYTSAFLEDAKLMRLKVVDDAERDPSLMPRPTQHIRAMLEMVMTLLRNGNAYIAPGGVAYFDTQSFPDYGALSGNTLERLRAGAGGRVSEAAQASKKHPADFMLWKPDASHHMRWDPKRELNDKACTLQEGYPGWHLECSVMAGARLGDVIDLHSGGEDNIFPHHECELAQSRCAHGTEAFARCWLHVRHLFVEGAKMSKSAGNFFTVRELVGKGFDPAAIRLELIRTHYRTNANFTEQGLRDSTRMIERWRRARVEIARRSTAWTDADWAIEISSLHKLFAKYMHDDLNISGAIGHLNSTISYLLEQPVDSSKVLRCSDEELWFLCSEAGGPPIDIFSKIDPVLGLLTQQDTLGAQSEQVSDNQIDDLIRRRTEARASKDFAEADRIRDELIAMGVEISDTPQGVTWSRKATLRD